MSNEELLAQVERFLERELSPEECEFLILASKALALNQQPLTRAAAAIAKIA